MNLDIISPSLQSDLRKYPTVVTRSLVPLDNSIKGSRHFGFYSTFIIFVGRMFGSGIFATPGLVMKNANGLYSIYMLFWFMAAGIAYTGLLLYLELGSYLPVNGATKKFLEYIYPRPAYMTTVVFSVFTILFSFSSTNALVFGEYIRYSAGLSSNEILNRRLACTLIVCSTLIHMASKKCGMIAQNILGTLKLGLIAFIILVCSYALLAPESMTHIQNQLSKETFKVPKLRDIQWTYYSVAILKCIQCFGGWTTCHIFQNEIKDPIRTLSRAGPMAFATIFLLYSMLNLTYLKVLPKEELTSGDQLAGALLFNKIFGSTIGSRIMSMIIAISSATNVIIVVYTDSLMKQEIFKEGFLPLSNILCSNYPFGTPCGGLIVHCIASCVVMYIPKRQIYDTIISIQYYPNQLFHALLCFGLLFKLRKKFRNIRAPIRASTICIYICLCGSLSVVLSPFLNGHFRFTLASYAALMTGFLYWLITFQLLPFFGHFEYRSLLAEKRDGLIYKYLVRDYNSK